MTLSTSARRSLFLISQLCSAVAEISLLFGLSLTIYLNSGSGLKTGLMIAMTYGGGIFGFLLVSFLKRRYRSVDIISSCELLGGLLLALLPFTPFVVSCLLLLGYGFLKAISRPFTQAVISKIQATAEEMRKLNADYQLVLILSSAISLAVLGSVAFTSNPQQVFLLCSILFLTSGTLIRCVEVNEAAIDQCWDMRWAAYFRRLGGGMRSICESPAIRSILLQGSVAVGLVVSFNAQIFTLAGAKNWPSSRFVILQATLIAGALIGGYLVRNRITAWFSTKDSGRRWAISLAYTGLCYVMIGLTASFWLCLPLLFFSSTAETSSMIEQNTSLHHNAGGEFMEEIFAGRTLIRNLAKAICSAVHGYVIERIGAGTSTLLVGLVIIVMITWAISISGGENERAA